MFKLKVKMSKEQFETICKILEENNKNIKVEDDCGTPLIYDGMNHIGAYDTEKSLFYCDTFVI